MLIWIFAAAVLFLILERALPDTALPPKQGWYLRALLGNAAQLGIVVVAGISWDRWLHGASLLHLDQALPSIAEGAVGYLVTTLVYYFWHRARHDVDLLWRTCHQLHHSPARIEILTSFYKHPVELVINSIMSSLISYSLLGLSIEGAAIATALSAFGEFFYHMNVRTPRWLGFFFQRPEMHRIHHQRGRHYDNFSDLPLWDMLFGTYYNPDRFDGPCGFADGREERIGEMLLFKNVNKKLPTAEKWQALKGPEGRRQQDRS